MDRMNGYVLDDDRLWVALAGENIEVQKVRMGAMKCNPERLLPYEIFPLKLRDKVMQYYAMYGQFNKVMEMMKSGHPLSCEVISHGIRLGDTSAEFEDLFECVNMIQHKDFGKYFEALVLNKNSIHKRMSLTAARYGRLDHLKKMYIRDEHITALICAAIYGGHVDVIEYLKKRKTGSEITNSMEVFCGKQPLIGADFAAWEIMLKYGKINYWPTHLPVNMNISKIASKSGNLKILARCDTSAAHAVSNDKLCVLKIINFSDIPLATKKIHLVKRSMNSIEDLVCLAMRRNKLRILKWLIRKFGTNFRFQKMGAEYHVSLPILDYLHGLGLVTRKLMIQRAYDFDNLSYMRKYLQNERLVLNRMSNNIKMMEFIKNTASKIFRCEFMANHIGYISVESCAWFHENKLLRTFDYETIVQNALGNDDPQILEWVKSINYPISNYLWAILSKIHCAEWLINEFNIKKVSGRKNDVKLPILLMLSKRGITFIDIA